MKKQRKGKSAPAKRARSATGKPSSHHRQESRLAILGEVAGVFNHEMRNIIGSFTTCLELLHRNPQLNKDDRELVDIMQSGAYRLNEIVDQFSAFGHRAPPRLESVDLSEIINDVIQRLRSDNRCPATIEISTRFDASIGQIHADRAELANVFWNLFLNAVQAMGDRGRLELETKGFGDAIEIHVGDSGPGVPASSRDKIFEPLFTTKTRATGLGLAIAKRMVEEHGGMIRLHQDPLGVTCFLVRLPTEHQANRPATRARPKRSSDHGPNRRRPSRK